jgi:hypothetical protein
VARGSESREDRERQMVHILLREAVERDKRPPVVRPPKPSPPQASLPPPSLLSGVWRMAGDESDDEGGEEARREALARVVRLSSEWHRGAMRRTMDRFRNVGGPGRAAFGSSRNGERFTDRSSFYHSVPKSVDVFYETAGTIGAKPDPRARRYFPTQARFGGKNTSAAPAQAALTPHVSQSSPYVVTISPSTTSRVGPGTYDVDQTDRRDSGRVRPSSSFAASPRRPVTARSAERPALARPATARLKGIGPKAMLVPASQQVTLAERKH